jgi:hypothetical protein
MRRSGGARELRGRLPARVRAGRGGAVGGGLSTGAWAQPAVAARWRPAGRLLVQRAFIIAPMRCSALALAWM